MLFVLESS
jgi:hypothetical protein